jgi:hypothetical protein
MARHLIVGDGTAFGVTNGLVDDGAVSVQKMSESGPTELVLGDTFVTAPQIRIVSGGSDGKNIATPWFYGRDVVDYSGKVGAAQAAQVKRAALATNATAVGQHTLKVMNKTNGNSPFESKSYTITVDPNATNTPTEQCTAFTTAINADLPHWVSSITNNGTSIDFTGFKKGETKADGSVQENLVEMELSFEAIDGNGNGTTMTESVQTAGSRGSGDGFYLQEYEDTLMGSQYGYYERRNLPIKPANQVATGTLYDMYNITATKDGSSSSQIHGVDNLIEVTLGLVAGDADSVVVENKLNGYFTGAFAPVIL